MATTSSRFVIEFVSAPKDWAPSHLLDCPPNPVSADMGHEHEGMSIEAARAGARSINASVQRDLLDEGFAGYWAVVVELSGDEPLESERSFLAGDTVVIQRRVVCHGRLVHA